MDILSIRKEQSKLNTQRSKIKDEGVPPTVNGKIVRWLPVDGVLALRLGGQLLFTLDLLVATVDSRGAHPKVDVVFARLPLRCCFVA